MQTAGGGGGGGGGGLLILMLGLNVICRFTPDCCHKAAITKRAKRQYTLGV